MHIRLITKTTKRKYNNFKNNTVILLMEQLLCMSIIVTPKKNRAY